MAQLLAARSNVDASDRISQTPLHCAAIEGHHKVVEQLLLATVGCRVNTTDKDDKTALHHAAPMATLLANPHITTERNYQRVSPLDLAVRRASQMTGAEAGKADRVVALLLVHPKQPHFSTEIVMEHCDDELLSRIIAEVSTSPTHRKVEKCFTRQSALVATKPWHNCWLFWPERPAPRHFFSS